MSTPSQVQRIRARAERQHGRVTRSDLLELDVPPREIARMAQRGWLKREYAEVYLVGHRPASRQGIWWSALQSMGPDATLAFRAAAASWDIVRGAVPTEVIVPLDSRRRSRDGITVRRRHLHIHEYEHRDGMRVTTLVRTHLDLAVVLSQKRLDAAFEQAQVHHHLDPNLLAAEILCHHGYPGMPKLRTTVEGAVDPDRVCSLLELRFLELCVAHGIPRPIVNEPLGPWMPDFLWADELVVVETDGWRFHKTAAQRRRDQEKDQWLRERGFEVIRLTWHDVTERPLEAATRVLTALAGT